MCGVLNMSGFWIFQDCQYIKFLNFQGYTSFTYFRKYGNSEYASGRNYGRVLNIPGFRICYISAYVSVTQGYEYAWIWQNNGWSNCYDRFDYSRFWICLVKVSQGFEYTSDSNYRRTDSEYGKVVNMQGLERIVNMPKWAWICLDNASICISMP